MTDILTILTPIPDEEKKLTWGITKKYENKNLS